MHNDIQEILLTEEQIKSKVNHEKFDEFLALTEKNPEMKAALLDYQAKMVQPQAKEKAEKRKKNFPALITIQLVLCLLIAFLVFNYRIVVL